MNNGCIRLHSKYHLLQKTSEQASIKVAYQIPFTTKSHSCGSNRGCRRAEKLYDISSNARGMFYDIGKVAAANFARTTKGDRATAINIFNI